MSAERGDQKPCTHTPCPGTMQFGRNRTPTEREVSATHGAYHLLGSAGVIGWVCSEEKEHFQRDGAYAD